MVEKAAVPPLPSLARQILRAAQALTTPATPSDYLELLNPLWSTRELLGTIREIRWETHDTATIVIEPSKEWSGHEPGQYLRVGVVIDGIRHWRAFTLTSDPEHPEGVISLTVKLVKDGLMSNYLLNEAEVGTVLYLGQVEGEFGIAERPKRPLLFLSAGSGITPLFVLLRHLHRKDWLDDVKHVFCVRTPDDVIYADYLNKVAEQHPGYSLTTWFSRDKGRFTPENLADLVPDWRERQTYLSAPPEMIETFKQHWHDADLAEQFEIERFQPKAGADVEPGKGGTIRFRVSDTDTEADGSTPILEAGEDAGLSLKFGCRMGICHTCVGRLAEGTVRDLRSGRVGGEVGDMIRICISCPEGHVEVDL